ncbi:L-threonylcarbamoyladenylate synthase [Sediminivirga luteola]|nr:L-threonylcarbamoyladenylate synthase [Sediminivirga luteola]
MSEERGEIYDCTSENVRNLVLEEAARTLADGELVVMPTDTVYGVAADAFSPRAVQDLLAAKGRGREMPPPVLIARPAALDGLAADVHPQARALAEEFWPGALTLILTAQPSLDWDLGETHGTVALRMPDHPIALQLLERTGPLAVSSANRTGMPAALEAAAAQDMLGGAVAVYLDAGRAPGGEASTIVDTTVSPFRVVRQGALPLERLRQVVPDLAADEGGAG